MTDLSQEKPTSSKGFFSSSSDSSSNIPSKVVISPLSAFSCWYISFAIMLLSSFVKTAVIVLILTCALDRFLLLRILLGLPSTFIFSSSKRGASMSLPSFCTAFSVSVSRRFPTLPISLASLLYSSEVARNAGPLANELILPLKNGGSEFIPARVILLTKDPEDLLESSIGFCGPTDSIALLMRCKSSARRSFASSKVPIFSHSSLELVSNSLSSRLATPTCSKSSLETL